MNESKLDVNGQPLTAWRRRQDEAVRARIKQLIADHAVDGPQRARCLAVLEGYWVSPFPDFHAPLGTWLPLYICQAVSGAVQPAIGPTAAAALAWTGTAFYDDLIDDELPADWRELSAAELTMTAMALISVIPLAAIDTFDLDAARRQELRAALAEGLLHMFAGQTADIVAVTDAMPSMEAVEGIARAKSGAMVAFPAAFGAIAGGADPETVAAYRAYGVALGVLLQFSNDAHDIFGKPWSHDLARGVKNMLVVAACEQLSGAARTDFLSLLDAARTSPEAQAEVRRMLRQKKLARPWLDVGMRHADDAVAALARAQPTPPMDDLLRGLVTDFAPTVEPGERLVRLLLRERGA